MYSEKKREIGENLQKAQSIALTTDSWTSRACQSYMTVTVHFVADDWTIKKFRSFNKDASCFTHRGKPWECVD